jgi:glycine cleavage system H protein
VGTEVTAGQPFGEVESTKSVSDVYAPVSGTVVERNSLLGDTPQLVNQSPYGDGWMIVIDPAQPVDQDFERLLDAKAYREFTERAAGSTD